MSKRVISIIVGILACLSLVSAATVSLTPLTVYEASSVPLSLDVNNYHGGSLVNHVFVNTSLTVSSAENYSGWSTTKTASSTDWNGGVLGTNVKSALFEFSVLTSRVAADTQVTFISTVNSASTNFTLVVLNDASAPNITGVSPAGFVRAALQTVTVNASDAETGVDSVIYTLNNCAGGANTTTSLSSNGSIFSGVANFSAFGEGTRACYSVVATNRAGENSTRNGELVVDGTPPVVSLVAPTNFVSENAQFTFSASDNLALTLTCTVSLNGTALGTISVPNSTVVNLSRDLSNFSEGQRIWSATCLDGVGLSTTQSLPVILDTSSPSVTLGGLSVRRTRATTFTFQASDTLGLSSVNATFENGAVALGVNGQTYNGTLVAGTLGIKQLTITAKDNVGHLTVKTVNVTVLPNHQVGLVLSTTQAGHGEVMTASGSILADGPVAGTSVLLRLPTGNQTLNLTNVSYSASFNAPTVDGSYLVSVEYTENGYVYSAQQSFEVVSAGISDTGETGSHGVGWSNLDQRGRPISAPAESAPAAEQTESQSAPSSDETLAPAPKPAPAYVPLQPEAPRSAYTPKATGIFSLGNKINWLAPLAALGVLFALGLYAYGRSPPKPKEDSLNWEDYFQN